jgi:hypothetical protein
MAGAAILHFNVRAWRKPPPGLCCATCADRPYRQRAISMRHSSFMNIYRLLQLCAVLLIAQPALGQLASTLAPNQDAAVHEITQLKTRVSQLERQVKKLESTGLVLFLFGVFCALWAQNTGRNAWLWFFLGLFGSLITVIVLLVKNSDDLFRESLRVKLD